MEDKGERRSRLSFATAAVILLSVLGYGLYVGYITHDVRLQSISLGVVASLVAALLFAMLSEWTDSPQTRIVGELNRSLGSVERIKKDAEARLSAGIISVSDKREHNPQFWFDILDGATNKLDLVGNSLSGWIEGDFPEKLKAHVARILASGGTVRIVFMDPGGSIAAEKSALLEKDYASHINGFVELLGELLERFPESLEAGHLGIHLAKDSLTYMMIDNGREIYVSPYLSVTRAAHPLVIKLDRTSKFAAGYLADFEKVYVRASRAT